MDGSSLSFETMVSVGSSSLVETQLLYISAVRGRDSPAASIQSRSRSCVLPGNESFAANWGSKSANSGDCMSGVFIDSVHRKTLGALCFMIKEG